MNVKGETMERLDVGGMTLEGFFLADYQRLRDENEELRRQVDGMTPSGYGVIDLGHATECVWAEVVSYHRLLTNKYDGITSESMSAALEMTDDELWEWATKKYKDQSSWCGGTIQPIAFKRHRFQYTLRVIETRSDSVFVTDARADEDEPRMYLLKEWENEECLECWQDAERSEYVKAQALKMLTDNIRDALPNVRKREEDEEKKNNATE
jgi:hypothetical protein